MKKLAIALLLATSLVAPRASADEDDDSIWGLYTVLGIPIGVMSFSAVANTVNDISPGGSSASLGEFRFLEQVQDEAAAFLAEEASGPSEVLARVFADLRKASLAAYGEDNSVLQQSDRELAIGLLRGPGAR